MYIDQSRLEAISTYIYTLIESLQYEYSPTFFAYNLQKNKTVAHELLETLKEHKPVLDWKKRTIGKMLVILN